MAHVPPSTDPELRHYVRYFYALKEVLRLRIVVALARQGEMTVTALAYALHVSQPLVSWHLRPLRESGLVTVRPVGRELHCSLNREAFEQHAQAFLDYLFPSATPPASPELYPANEE